MASIVEFLEARIAEDETEARKAIEERTSVLPNEGEDMSLQCWPDVGVPAVLVGPERILAECEAKRAIIEDWEDPSGISPLDSDVDAGHVLATDSAVRALAAVYKDHPDYQQEWARG